MPVSLLQKWNQLDGRLARQLQVRAGVIFQTRPRADQARNREALINLFQHLFLPGRDPSLYIARLKNWQGMTVVEEALRSFGKLPGDHEGAWQMASHFPALMVYDGQEFHLTWEFLHYLGRQKFFLEKNFLLSHLYELPAREIREWASWLNPHLRVQRQEQYIEYIYEQLGRSRPTTEPVLLFNRQNIALDYILPGSSPELNWVKSRDLPLYRFFQRWEKRRNSVYPAHFRQGFLICRPRIGGQPVERKKLSGRERASFVVRVPTEFADSHPENQMRSAY